MIALANVEKPLRSDQIGKPGQRPDGSWMPFLLCLDGRPLAGYWSEKGARDDGKLYRESWAKKRTMSIRPTGAPVPTW